MLFSSIFAFSALLAASSANPIPEVFGLDIPVGGTYFCTKSNFDGDCEHMMQTPGECYAFEGQYAQNVGSFTPAWGTTCRLFS